jgi:hypothetical protein
MDLGDRPRPRVLLDHFSLMEDDRASWRVAHPLPEVLLLVVCGTIAVCDDFEEIVEWGEDDLPFLRRFLPFHHGIPGSRWLRILLNRMDADVFPAIFVSWAAALRPDAPALVALDGKTSRGSLDRSGGRAALHLVSAFAARERLVIGQEADRERPPLGARRHLRGGRRKDPKSQRPQEHGHRPPLRLQPPARRGRQTQHEAPAQEGAPRQRLPRTNPRIVTVNPDSGPWSGWGGTIMRHTIGVAATFAALLLAATSTQARARARTPSSRSWRPGARSPAGARPTGPCGRTRSSTRSPGSRPGPSTRPGGRNSTAAS